MQALFELVTGFLTALAALAFAQFGVALHGEAPRHAQVPEVHRVAHRCTQHAEADTRHIAVARTPHRA
jgi:hypothetical protein